MRRIEFRACNDSLGEIWIVNDITERDLIERDLIAAKDRAEAGARSKSEFLANMSHELRTPLTAIIGFAELLAREGSLAPQERHWLARIEDASKALHSIVNDVLDFSKLEEGAVELESEPFRSAQASRRHRGPSGGSGRAQGCRPGDFRG